MSTWSSVFLIRTANIYIKYFHNKTMFFFFTCSFNWFLLSISIAPPTASQCPRTQKGGKKRKKKSACSQHRHHFINVKCDTAHLLWKLCAGEGWAVFQIHIVRIRLNSVRSDSTLNTGLMNESTVATIKLSGNFCITVHD